MTFRSMQKSLLFLLCCSAALLGGCGENVRHGNVEDKLAELKNTFEVQFPTNYTAASAASRSTIRGFSETFVRLDITKAVFTEWRQSSTNRLFEFQELNVPVDPEVESRIPWWNCSTFPQVTHYYTDKHAGHKGHLDIFVVQTNQIYIMYIDGKTG